MCAAVPTLKASPDFQRISRQGRKWVGPGFIMLVFAPAAALAESTTPESTPAAPLPFRCGFTVSRKVGNAVVRNRAKRRLREMVRLLMQRQKLEGFEIVLIGKTAAATLDFIKMSADFEKGLRHFKVFAA